MRSLQFREKFARDPDVVVCTNAGGGNLTGTTRGLIKAGASTQVVAAQWILRDCIWHLTPISTGSLPRDTRIRMPFSIWPDRSDVPRSAARPMRYIDRYVTITQGSVFYMTEAPASLEGLEKGPAGNTSLAAAFALAQELPEDQMIVVQETEYTGAGKHVQPQLTFAKSNGIEVFFGDPKDEVPGKNIVLPSHPSLIKVKDQDLDQMRKSLIRTAVNTYKVTPTEEDIVFLAEETKSSEEFVKQALAEL